MELKTQQLYRHYKNKFYKYLGVVKHSESLEDLILYKTLYKNTHSELWVRPKNMFFEEIEIDGKKLSRFESVQFHYHFFNKADDQLIKILNNISKSVFSEFDDNKIEVKLKNKKSLMIIVVSKESSLSSNSVIGFKLGYELTDEVYYSWLGAVHPEYRGLGVGLELLTQQHQWCETMGFKSVETKTTNKWKDMLLLNLKFGFDIYGTECNSKNELKILLRKNLNVDSVN